MNQVEKLYTIIILCSVLLGLGLGQWEFAGHYGLMLIVPLLIGMLYMTFLQIPLREMKQSFRNFTFSLTSLLLNFVWTPLLAWGLTLLFLQDHPALWLGFIMLMVTPCTDWYLIFTTLARGNLSLSTSILPINLILQIILLPFYLLLFGGTRASIDLSNLMESVILVLCLPLILAFLTKFIVKNRKSMEAKWVSQLSTLPIVLLSLAIAAMFASQGKLLLDHIELLWQILIPISLFFLINFIVGQGTGRFLRMTYADRASLSLTTLARNSPIALAIAMTAFPDQPLIALTLVIGPLLELPILAIITQLLLWTSRGQRT